VAVCGAMNLAMDRKIETTTCTMQAIKAWK
jgi:hypothetical protein